MVAYVYLRLCQKCIMERFFKGLALQSDRVSRVLNASLDSIENWGSNWDGFRFLIVNFLASSRRFFIFFSIGFGHVFVSACVFIYSPEEYIKIPIKHLRWLFDKNDQWRNYFRRIFHLRCLTGFWTCLCSHVD